MEERKRKKFEGIGRIGAIVVGLFLIVEAIFLLNFLLIYSESVSAVTGEDNVTVPSTLDVGNSAPQVINVTINFGNSIGLIPNTTTLVEIVAIVEDFNGQDDIFNLSLIFFDNFASSPNAANDNNNHYINASCFLDKSYGNVFQANASRLLNLAYYSNNATWNATVTIQDNSSFVGRNSDIEAINSLLALGVPNSIDYGTVNSTFVSEERIANVTNYGNVGFNLTLEGFARNRYDNYSMNCTLGIPGNISVGYEKYNLTFSHNGSRSLLQFESNYTNLTSVLNPTILFNRPQRQVDSSQFVDDTNATYWRIYVPPGVAGSCTGNLRFGAVQNPA